MNYTISVDDNMKIIRYKHTGIIKAEEVESAWYEFLKLREFTELRYNLLSDYRGARFDIPLVFADAIVDFMRNIESVVRGKKQSLIVDDPYSTAASMLFEGKVNLEVGFLVRVFSTEEPAIEWLIK